MADDVNLDIHALAELKKRNFPPTNDKPKYSYTADSQGNYSECTYSNNNDWMSKYAICRGVLV